MRVILLPGMDGTGILFEPLIKELGSSAQVQTITYKTDLVANYEQLARQVITKLPTINDYILVAESFSGPIGYLIATNPPENLKAIIFLSTFLSPPNRFMWLISKLPLRLLLKLPMPGFAIKSFLLGRGITNDVTALFKKSIKLVNCNVLAFRIKEMAKLKLAIKPISVPCSYIYASHDKLVAKRHINEFRQIASDIEIVKIEGPHFIAQANPKECARVMRKYIAK